MISDQIRRIAEQFQIQGTLKDAIPIVQGHINDTYRLISETPEGDRQYALQDINQ